MEDIETAITGKTVEDNLLEHNIPEGGIIIEPSQRQVLNGGDNYEALKKAEVKTNWLRHEGTLDFIGNLGRLREDKLIEAETLAKNGNAEAAFRLLIKCCALRETIEIIKEI